MLVLAVRVGQSVMINGHEMLVKEIRENGQVVLSFDFPQEILIHRKAIYDKLKRNGELKIFNGGE